MNKLTPLLIVKDKQQKTTTFSSSFTSWFPAIPYIHLHFLMHIYSYVLTLRGLNSLFSFTGRSYFLLLSQVFSHSASNSPAYVRSHTVKKFSHKNVTFIFSQWALKRSSSNALKPCFQIYIGASSLIGKSQSHALTPLHLHIAKLHFQPQYASFNGIIVLSQSHP